MMEIQHVKFAFYRPFAKVDFNPPTYGSQIKTHAFYSQDKVEILRRRRCLPSIDFHGIEKSFD